MLDESNNPIFYTKFSYTHPPLSASGTSYSTAFTSGACALWLLRHGRQNLIDKYGKSFLFDVFKYCLLSSCQRPDNWEEKKRGKGIIDVKELIKYDLPDVDEIKNHAKKNGWEG